MTWAESWQMDASAHLHTHPVGLPLLEEHRKSREQCFKHPHSPKSLFLALTSGVRLKAAKEQGQKNWLHGRAELFSLCDSGDSTSHDKDPQPLSWVRGGRERGLAPGVSSRAGTTVGTTVGTTSLWTHRPSAQAAAGWAAQGGGRSHVTAARRPPRLLAEAGSRASSPSSGSKAARSPGPFLSELSLPHPSLSSGTLEDKQPLLGSCKPGGGGRG